MRLIDADAAIDTFMNALNDVGILDSEDINNIFQMLPTAEPTYEQIKDYCNKRCLSIVDNALLQKICREEKK